jgi:hypothetical protein
MNSIVFTEIAWEKTRLSFFVLVFFTIRYTVGTIDNDTFLVNEFTKLIIESC